MKSRTWLKYKKIKHLCNNFNYFFKFAFSEVLNVEQRACQSFTSKAALTDNLLRLNTKHTESRSRRKTTISNLSGKFSETEHTKSLLPPKRQ